MIEGSYRDCITTAQLRTGGTQQATGRYWCQDNNFQNGFHIWADDAYLQFRAGGTNWNDYSNAKNNTVYEVVTAVKGDYCDVWIDGEHLFTYKDAGFFTNGRHGFRFYNPDSTQYVDDLEMYTCLVSPTQVTDCLFWLDASYRGTTTNQWDDKSGNGNHFVSTNAAYFPTFAGGAATFDGSLTFLEGPDLSALTEGEIFLVMNRYADTSESGGNTGWMHFGTDTVQNDHFAYLNSIYTDFGVTSRQGIGNPTGSLATDMVVNISVDSTSGFDFSLSGLINGLTVHRFNNASVTVDFSSAPTLGKSDGAYYFQGDIKAVVMYSRKLTTVERALVTAYLKDTHF
jgi:hypothetical protein